MNTRGLAILTALVSVVFAVAEAKAAGKDAKERAAKKACLSGDYAKGVAILADLYVDTNDSNYLFNQARCYQQNHRYEDAISRFREFLVKAENLSDQEKAQTEKHIAACQSYLGITGAETQPAAPAITPIPVPAPATQTKPDPVPQPNVSAFQPAASGSAGSGLRTAGIVTLSVGGAALIAGVILSLKVNSMTSDLEQPNAYNRGTDATRKDYKTLTWVSYSVGAACVVGGSVLYYLGWSKSRDSSVSLALVPTVSSHGAGAVLTGGF